MMVSIFGCMDEVEFLTLKRTENCHWLEVGKIILVGLVQKSDITSLQAVHTPPIHLDNVWLYNDTEKLYCETEQYILHSDSVITTDT